MKALVGAILIVGLLIAGSIVYASRPASKPKEAACHFYASSDGVQYHRDRCEPHSPWKLVR